MEDCGGDVELGIVWVFPDEDCGGGFEDVDAIEEELDKSWSGKSFVGTLSSEFDGEGLEVAVDDDGGLVALLGHLFHMLYGVKHHSACSC